MLINGDDNIQFKGDNNIVGDGNTVNNHFYNGSDNQETPKEEKVLPFSMKVYRRRNFFAEASFYTICFVGILAFAKFQITLPYIIPFLILVYLLWHVLPMNFSSLLVSVYSDRISIGNNEIFFEDMWDCKYGRGIFSYKIHGDDIPYTIEFYKNYQAEYICYKIKQFEIFTK